jgi:hypothetical protein
MADCALDQARPDPAHPPRPRQAGGHDALALGWSGSADGQGMEGLLKCVVDAGRSHLVRWSGAFQSGSASSTYLRVTFEQPKSAV